ncbi:beta-glucoside-specific PTS transporter subunit IIABC [Saccharibacillus kuerlensis]|uniref:PTS system beta-glucoside-specific EIIBCA component n=1 Tax=Saccharibacillus kuerlensis TaxID=459527 RepID=A0ABQ2L794_9BACL|nr:beta-glucoside-specific PTS transporter subunit IIABC [Saccharibacillus kuerlensis]GGO02969.1 PTS system beta-glucoside-specific EIIBCA component [Saccharibacillus kuerlensis]
MSKHEQTAKSVIEKIGGESNVKTMTHCMTRLRFELRDNNKADRAALENTPGVMGTNIAGTQFQVIIGNDVPKVYEEINKAASFGGGSAQTDDAPKQKKNPFSALLDIISGIFTPLLPALAGAGMIKALLSVSDVFGWMATDGSTYQILKAIGDGTFFFLPILIAFSAARKFGSSMFLAAAIAAAVMHPDLTALLGSGGNLNFLGLPVTPVTYSSSVIPMLLAIWISSYVEKFFNRFIPSALKVLFVPMLTLLVIVPATLIAFGPLGSIIGQGLAGGITWLLDNTGIFGGLLLGGTMSLIIMTGMHWALVPIAILSLAEQGFDYILPIMFAANLGQAGATFGVFLRSRNPQFKALSLSTSFSAMMGITEPAMYGVNMRLKKPFVSGLIGGAVGGAVYGLFHVKIYVMAGGAGLPGIPAMIGPTFVYGLIGMAVAFAVGAVVTFIMGFQDVPVPASETTAAADATAPAASNETPAAASAVVVPEVVQIRDTALSSPLTGTVKALSDVDDVTFAGEYMGKGIAVVPSAGVVTAPADGIVNSLAVTKHAIGMQTTDGAELLIHVGLNTVRLKGQHFNVLVEEGQAVTAGQPLLTFNMSAIRAAGYDLTTPMIVTNTKEFDGFTTLHGGAIEAGQPLLKLDVAAPLLEASGD